MNLETFPSLNPDGKGSVRMPQIDRRSFLLGGAAALGFVAAPNCLQATSDTRLKSPFRLAVITDEISPDFDHACSVAANEFGMQWVEVRSMWNKSLFALSPSELDDARRILDKYKLRVTDIASPLFKADWPGAPISKKREGHAQPDMSSVFRKQEEVLKKSIEVAKAFDTNRIRGFDFWRLDDVAPYRAAINAKLVEAAAEMERNGKIFILENEMSCNTGTGAEAAKVLAAIPSKNFMLNWDPGNAAALGEKPFPDGWDLLPKDRIGHCHCKDTVLKPSGGYQWAAVGKGVIDWVGQFKAFMAMKYELAVSLETHWHGGSSPEDSTRQSWAGMKAALRTAGALS